MRSEQVRRFYREIFEKEGGSTRGIDAAIARAAGCSPQAVYQWGEIVPFFSASRLAELHPELALERDDYDARGRPRKLEGTAA